MTEFLDNSAVLITGGTGSFGTALTERLLQTKVRKIIIYSRGELAQVNLRRRFQDDKRLRLFIGDVRDKGRLSLALNGVDYVFHAAALKHVDICEINPIEAIKTNILGAQNLITASIERGVKKVLAISTDKAVDPANLYGAAKLCSDKLFVAGNVYGNTKFSVIRFGNFWKSNGSVVEYFEELKNKKCAIFPITDRRMKRFFIHKEEAAKMALNVLDKMEGEEIFVPEMKEYSIRDIALQIEPMATLKEVGIRPGEKLREILFSKEDEIRTTFDKELNCHVTLPY